MFKKLLRDFEFREHAEIYLSGPYTQHDQITEAREQAIVSLYNGGKNYSLNKLKFQQFKENVGVRCSKQIQAQVLPPTSGVAKYHSLRVFMNLSNEKETTLMPLNMCGRRRMASSFFLRSYLPPAPNHLLEALNVHFPVVTVKALAAPMQWIQNVIETEVDE